MDNFNLKKFLVENKLTSNSKSLKEEVHEEEEAPNLAKKPTIEVTVRHAREAGEAFRDTYSKMGKMTSTNTFEFKNADDAEEFAEYLMDYTDIPEEEITGYNLDESSVNETEEERVHEEEVQEGESVSKYLSLEGAEAIMKELEKDSSKAYMEAKMSKLKEVVETLESKCKSLEESDDAAFISSSKLKEMKNTSKKLRKYEEKMVKEYDKKYAE